jgi:hypothetical protein
MAKQLLCAAASNSSGFVPPLPGLANRDRKL